MFRKYFEQGYVPIPICKGGKNPAIANDWSKWCFEKPSDFQIDEWDEHRLKFGWNIGVTCGPASGIIALDIDKDDKDFLDACPRSPVVRRGAKGEARFFRYDSSIKSRSYPGLDILSDGRQVLIPPSIHPTTRKPYTWLTPDTLENLRATDLPFLSLNFLPELMPKLKAEASGLNGGRNNKLRDMISAMRSRGESESKIVQEVYEWDREYNTPRLFMDPAEQYRAKNESEAKQAAWLMVSSVTRSLISTGAIVMGEHENLVVHLTDDQERAAILDAEKHAFKFKSYPKPRGFMGKFQELCELQSAGSQEATGLGGALALMAVLASNRFVTECRGRTTAPNLYIINLGYSSFGKEMAQSVIAELLGDTDLLGAGNYKSDVSFIMRLPEQQERLDIIDECSSLLKAMGSKEGYASNIVELLSELFTKGPTKYNGQSTAQNGAKFGACYNPHISLLGSTTPKGFRSSVNQEVAAKGLLPRMLLFFQNDVGDYRGRKDRSRAPELMAYLHSFVEGMQGIDKIRHPAFDEDLVMVRGKDGKDHEQATPQGVRYVQTLIPMTAETHEAWLNYDEKCHNMKRKDPEGFESAFIGRFAEIAAKLALLDALSLGAAEIEIDSLEWAIEVVETQWYNSKSLYELTHAENHNQAETIKVLKRIERAGIIDRSALLKNGLLKSKDLDTIILTLQESRQIEVIKTACKGMGRPKTMYKVVSSVTKKVANF